MKRVPQLDFLAGAPRPWAGLLICSAALLLLAAAGWSNWQVEQRNREAGALIAERIARAAPPPRRLTEAERVRLAQTERLAGELRAPWAELLATFEEHSRADVGLLKLEPDARGGMVRVTGQAKDVKALFSYLLELEGDGRLAEVALTNHQAEREVPGQPLRFTIQAAWRTGAAAGTKATP